RASTGRSGRGPFSARAPTAGTPTTRSSATRHRRPMPGAAGCRPRIGPPWPGWSPSRSSRGCTRTARHDERGGGTVTSMTGSVVALVGLTLLAIALAWLVYRRDLVRCLREPVLRSPVLVFESDDWSPGEADQAQALAAIAAVLRRFRDRDGRHPKFALGVILA